MWKGEAIALALVEVSVRIWLRQNINDLSMRLHGCFGHTQTQRFF